MPEYDATNYPKPLAPNLTGGEVGREPTDLPAHWPHTPLLNDPYAGAVPSREWETIANRVITDKPVPPVPPPADAPAPMESISPPPGHTAQP